jgi:kumamolisin
MSKTRIEFEASHRSLPPGARRVVEVPPDETIEVSVYLKPRPDAEEPPIDALPVEERRAALQVRRALLHEGDIRLLREFAGETGLTVSAVDPGQRLVKLSGPASKMEAAFETALGIYDDGRHQFRGRVGALTLPQDVHAVVEAVLGLDNRQAVKSYVLTSPDVTTAHLPNAVGALYGFPTGVTGAKQCIALIRIGGGFYAADNANAFAAMGLATPEIIAVSVDGAQNNPGVDRLADRETALDIQVAGGIAPDARIAVYFTPNRFQSSVDALSVAVHDDANKPEVISISWGSIETLWPTQARDAFNTILRDAVLLRISVFAAAGDHLATEGDDKAVHVNFPASSPLAIGCGGTTVDSSGNTINSEVVWNDGGSPPVGTGGGISTIFQVPPYQKYANLPVNVSTRQVGRGVPDVAGDASPDSGYKIIVNGVLRQLGGTSAVAPLWAGLTALINESAPYPIGCFLPQLYRNPGLVRGITEGNNKPPNTNLGYSAGIGWNGCTGLGVPIGSALYQALKLPMRGMPVLIQSTFGTQGNFELAVPLAAGGVAHYVRLNDQAACPWAGPDQIFGLSLGQLDGISMIQNDYGGNPGNLAVVARVNTLLMYYHRDSGPNFAWRGSKVVVNGYNVTGLSGNPVLIQSRFGTVGNYEVVVPLTIGGLAHFVRVNDVSTAPWCGPDQVFGASLGAVDAVSMIQSNYGSPGNLEVVARVGDKLFTFWRDSGPDFHWSGPFPLAVNGNPVAGVSGNPVLIQSTFGLRGNFELVVPLAAGGLAHYARINDDWAPSWVGPDQIFGASLGVVDAVSMIQSNYGNPGHLEVTARVGYQLFSFWRDSGPGFDWSGPFAITGDR